MTRKEKLKHEKRMKALAIVATVASLILALTLAFMTGANSATRSSKAYKYNLECLTELHNNPLMECREEQ